MTDLGTAVGATLGVEEEYHLVDAVTGALADAPQVVEEGERRFGAQVQSEISTAQLEIGTPVCSTLGEVRASLRRLRAGAAAVAAESGVAVLACGTHPFGTWRDQRLTGGERYVRLHERWGLLALQQLITGTHVHVSVPDPELAIQVLDRLRPDLPTLLAMSGSSPYWEGSDTGYASFRTQWYARFSVTGMPEVFGSRAAYDETVAALVRAGIADDASHLYWDARPATRYPTLEVRVGDTMPRLDDAVLHAGLARALVQQAAEDALAGLPVPALRPEVARAARWRAARHGLEGELVDCRSGALVPAAELVHGLVARVRPQLERTGDLAEVCALTEATLARGTSARRQRELMARTGDLAQVVHALVAEAQQG
ncbi:MAG TPA: glutamate--cysteine ligase [Mycobacteriales bacterium]|nr:glutamate--cysteine ligase [Mycobacteriales bacterium]